jgi:predicted O-linked N-acetylglucosamine transferase (SPINDLY family)
MDLYRQGDYKRARQEAEALTKKHSADAFAWKALGNCQLQLGDPNEAKFSLEKAYSLAPEDPLTLTALSRACFMLGEKDRARSLQERSIELDPSHAQAHFNMANMFYQIGAYARAEKYLIEAEALGHSQADVLAMRSIIHSLHFQFQEGLETLERLKELRPTDPTVLNTLGNYHKDMADFETAQQYYSQSLRLSPQYYTAYSNGLLNDHYNPTATAESILDKSKAWREYFTPPRLFEHDRKNLDRGRPLRIGLLSSNLRVHPVGWMVGSALEQLPGDIELYAYTDNDAQDPIADKIKQVCHWIPTYHLGHQELADRIFADDIDILIDLAGHGAQSRLPVIDMKPAPIIIKWVGMQISSMGIAAFDYFLSDHYETPTGVDHLYTEKLIRLPNDYICYTPPPYKPPITSLPAIGNGFVTFGCFNNPAKVNDVLLAEWAKLMHTVPGSRLFLKGGQYSSPVVCERILSTLERHDINRQRVLLEGPANHGELLKSYNKVDIALDTWPYSGGLTTCEALLMGVPVVTLPGPTFAGRHSATHLTNAGMQELVVSSWEEYRQRVIELASDLPSLAVIRAALRTYLEQSPICDDERFAGHLHKTLRAIWQRHCEGKPPAGLTFNKGGQAWFEDDSKPVKLPTELQRDFDWNLETPVTILDNGAGIAMRSDARELLSSGNIAVLAFDPINALGNAEELAQYGEIQHFPHVTLGNAQPATLRGVEGESDITSLKPLVTGIADSLQTLEIPSIALDSIEGLESLDVLALDDRHDNLAILEHGTSALEKALLLQIRVRFNPTHEGQADLGSLTRWASEHGFRFYRLHNGEYRSHLPDDAPAELKQASELVSADALFVPNETYAVKMSDEQRVKLAFMLHTAYGVKDMALSLLHTTNKKEAEKYLLKEGITVVEKPKGSSSIQDIIHYLEAESLTPISGNHKLPEQLIVSLTSYKARFNNLHLTLRSLLLQETQPDLLILWIAEHDKNDIPNSVWELEQYGLSIRFCDDLRSYKKIIPALEAYPDSFIVTADDDIYYQPDWLQKLLKSWDGNHKTVTAHRAHKIRLDDNRNPVSYRDWKWQVGPEEPADGLIFPTSGAGALYPPNVFHKDVIKSEIFMELCPDADDIWLYWMASLNGAKAKRSDYGFQLIEWPSESGIALWHSNIYQDGNDRQINNLVEYYGLAKELTKEDCKTSSEKTFNVKKYWEERYLRGGTSGTGSYGRLAIFKSETLNKLISDYRVDNIIEFGCGDGNQLSLLTNEVKYLGVDISSAAIGICRKKFADDPKKQFLTLKDFECSPESATMSISLDVIYHLVDDDIFHDYMNTLFSHSIDYCVIYSANIDERTADPHVRKRKFSDWIDEHAPKPGLFMRSARKRR